MQNSRDIDDLHPIVAAMCREFVAACDAEGIEVLITSTYRDEESQNSLYAQGRTKPGKRVTNAKGGQSFHNWHVAFDFVPIVNGKALWNDIETFDRCGELAESVGLEWGGLWNTPDKPHCQYTGGLTIADFQNGSTL